MVLFDFSNYDQLIPLVTNSLIAGALLALVGGLIGIFVMNRDMSFAVHGISELSFAGAAFALLAGMNVVLGSVLGSIAAAFIIGALGAKAKERNSIVAVLMPAGLGLGILALALYEGRAANKFGLLTGQIVAVDDPQLAWLATICISVLVISGRGLAATEFCQPRPRGCRRSWRANARTIYRLHAVARPVGCRQRSGGRRPAGAQPAGYAGCRRPSPNRVTDFGSGALGSLCSGFGSRRHFAGARRRLADQPIRDLNFFSDLCGGPRD